jgi:XcyI restriction endonuclease
MAPSSPRKLIIENASRRRVEIVLAADPDIRVVEDFSGELRNKVAIEIKGGTDRSNAHNRAGEAEKSHQKARLQGFRDFWTIIAMKGVDRKRLQQESPTSRSWFDVASILARTGHDWDEFRSRLSEVVGIPVE